MNFPMARRVRAEHCRGDPDLRGGGQRPSLPSPVVAKPRMNIGQPAGLGTRIGIPARVPNERSGPVHDPAARWRHRGH